MSPAALTSPIVVVGGINMDIFIEAERFPRPGETFEGDRFSTGGGGKGANQAVAAARAAGHPGAVQMVGRVGDDIFGADLLKSLEGYGVGVSGIEATAGEASGIALIFSDASKQNHVLPVYGANATCGDRQVAAARRMLTGARALLVQQEIPVDVSMQAMQAARDLGVTVILDPSPVRDVPPGFLALADIAHPNQLEASTLTGIDVTGPESAARAAAELRSRTGIRVVIVKLGPEGCWVESDGYRGHAPGHTITVAATVAAGDAFAGGLAVGLAEGMDLRQSVRLANACGALCVSRPGAQDSMATRAEIDALLSADGRRG